MVATGIVTLSFGWQKWWASICFSTIFLARRSCVSDVRKGRKKALRFLSAMMSNRFSGCCEGINNTAVITVL